MKNKLLNLFLILIALFTIKNLVWPKPDIDKLVWTQTNKDLARLEQIQGHKATEQQRINLFHARYTEAHHAQH